MNSGKRMSDDTAHRPLRPFQVAQFRRRLEEYPQRRAELENEIQRLAAVYRDALAREAPFREQMETAQRGYDDAKRRGDTLAALDWLARRNLLREAYARIHAERLQAYSDGRIARYYADICEQQAREAAAALGVAFDA